MKSMAIESPLGTLVAREKDSALCAVLFSPSLRETKEATDTSPLLEETRRELEEYFRGERKVFDLPLHLEGSEFQKSVWQAIATIPYGETRCYGDLAKAIGTKGYQAVGSACGRNPIPIIIPCHRVISRDGTIGGFSGPMEVKRHLLLLEGASWKEQIKARCT